MWRVSEVESEGVEVRLWHLPVVFIVVIVLSRKMSVDRSRWLLEHDVKEMMV